MMIITSINKTLTITAIVLVAVVMGMSMIAPAMADHNRGHTQAPIPCEKIFRALANAGVDKEVIQRVLITIGC